MALRVVECELLRDCGLSVLALLREHEGHQASQDLVKRAITSSLLFQSSTCAKVSVSSFRDLPNLW